MILWAFGAFAMVILCFGLVVFVGPPYLPTFDAQARRALDMLELQPGQTLLELGSGDGKVLARAAATGLNVVGIELNPILVLVSRMRTWRQRKQVKIVWGNFWDTGKWPTADGIFGFILPKYMKTLDTKIVQWQVEQGRSVRFVSFAFPLPDKRPIRQDNRGLYLYEYK